VALIHPESHLTDETAKKLRGAVYQRLLRHWHFVNELMLYEIAHRFNYGVNVYRGEPSEVNFLHATSLYHPSTVEGSLVHSGDGLSPGLKDQMGHWDLRPHASRVQRVDSVVLQTWSSAVESTETSAGESKMVYLVSQADASVLG